MDARDNVPMVTAYVALGSNVGDRLSHLQAAVDRLRTVMRVTRASHVYESAPMYVTDQPAFLNAAISVKTDLSPTALLAVLKETEREVGRQQRQRYGPREVDLDLVAYGALEYVYRACGRTVLELPHPKTVERRFVLQPLFDIDPQLTLPGLGRVKCLLAQTDDQIADLKRSEHAVLSI